MLQAWPKKKKRKERKKKEKKKRTDLSKKKREKKGERVSVESTLAVSKLSQLTGPHHRQGEKAARRERRQAGSVCATASLGFRVRTLFPGKTHRGGGPDPGEEGCSAECQFRNLPCMGCRW